MNTRGAGDDLRPPAEEEIVTEKDTWSPCRSPVPASRRYSAGAAPPRRNRSGVRGPPLGASIGRRVGAAISRALRNMIPSHGQDGPTAVIYLDARITAKDATL